MAMRNIFRLSLFFLFCSVELFSYAWVQVAENGEFELRVIVTQKNKDQEFACPTALINNSKVKLKIRAEPEENFGNLVCFVKIEKKDSRISLEYKSSLNLDLRLSRNPYKPVLILGDTGCGNNNPYLPQDCSKVHSWPFKAIINDAARNDPRIIIHTGDYRYRNMGNNIKWQDNWADWKADFFEPAAKILNKAPWIFSRGNHEACNKAHIGWRRYLDPDKYDSGLCRERHHSYFFKYGEIKLTLFDSSSITDRELDEDLAVKIKQELKNDLAKIGYFRRKHQDVWFLTHRPVWGLIPICDDSYCEPSISVNLTMQKAFEDIKDWGVKRFLAGHIHLFDLFHYDDLDPYQIVVGNGGNSLSHFGYLSDFSDSKRTILERTTISDYGYVLAYHYNAWALVTRFLNQFSNREFVLP